MVTKKEFEDLPGEVLFSSNSRVKFGIESGRYDKTAKPGVQVFYASAANSSMHNEEVSVALVEAILENCKSMTRKCTCIRSDMNFYLGRRITYQASSSPSCGPGQQRDHFYQSQNSDPKFDITINTVIRNLIDKAMGFAARADSLMSNLMPHTNNFCRYTRLALLTVNFFNTSHKDRNDKFDKDHLDWLQFLLDKFYRTAEMDFYKQYIDRYAERFGVLVTPDTTCGYQFVSKNGLDVSRFQQFFVLNSLGIVVRLLHRCSINFLGGLVYHSTAVPLLLLPNSRIMIPSQVNGNFVFAWGSSSDGGPNYRQFHQQVACGWRQFQAHHSLPAAITLQSFVDFVAFVEAAHGVRVADMPVGHVRLMGALPLSMHGAVEAYIASRNAWNVVHGIDGG